ncbi:MAG: hypothetical protein HIU57_08135 [Acidobacteria bacterium]|nr:hypothetical protein [Acidobacteriota bacterium]
MNVVEYVLGLVIVVITITGILFVLVLPRQPFGIERLTLIVNRAVRLIFIGLSRLATTYERKDAILAPTAPVALLGQILIWAASLILGFGIMLVPTTHSWWLGIEQSTTALFTVGAIHEGGAANIGIDIWAGATWVIVVALQIAYLPTLYGAFSRRESLVAMLESRAGAPAWGPELLTRHQLVGITDTLPDLYKDWEMWAADVAESHSTYPILLLFRSPEPWLSWLLGLLAVLDAAALQLAVAPSTAPSQARLCLRMGFTLTNRIATTLGWVVNFDPRPDEPIQLSYAEFAQAVAMLERSGFPVERSAEEAWPDFHGWRVNYEESMYHLTDRLIAPPAKWSGGRRHLREAAVEPHRPPHRHPGSNPEATFEEPLAVNSAWGWRARRRRSRPRHS